MKIDVTLVAGRRPLLLAQTLASFHDALFSHFEIENFLVNIDPIFGDETDHQHCVQILRDYAPRAQIFSPETPSFGAAVQRLWTQTHAPVVFHLEDDWECLELVTPADISALRAPIVQLSLVSQEKGWDGKSRFHLSKRRQKIAGVTVWKRWVPAFTTSPSFLLGDFARNSAALLNPNLDPEKQFYSGTNPALESHVAGFFNQFLPGKTTPVLIRDTGRAWREKRHIEKQLVAGRSVWAARNNNQ